MSRHRGTTAEALVRFVGVHKTYDGVNRVVDDLDLDILRGEFLTLLGPSGSGKTTTLMLLAGFEAPTAGAILLDGRSIAALPPHRREIGMVFQHYALFPHMTVAENVGFPLSVRRLPKSEIATRVERALAMVQLAALAGRRPAQLSGGQQQRVAVARALVYQPKLVLMDEPLGALDKQLREQMQLEIRRLHRDLGVTMVYVTHDQSEALTMSDRIAVFHQGRIQQIGTPESIYDRPANAFVARFIGENNRVTGTVERVDGGRCAVRAVGGAILAGTSGAALAPGQLALVSVRPEQIVLGDAPADCALHGTLAEAIYLGDHLRLRIAVDEMGDIVVKSHSAQAPAVGASVRLGWRAEDCRVFRLDQD
ncbi:MAG TPA: ABC transporter ATP-binding protein [Casimicrobiaceae bacterium]|nr:ABC transporter ATP-binding protein [Casimicrobiaceae bacterium]